MMQNPPNQQYQTQYNTAQQTQVQQQPRQPANQPPSCYNPQLQAQAIPEVKQEEVLVSRQQKYNIYPPIGCKQVYCHCQAPQFGICQPCCGCMTATFPGVGLQFCCCFGCARQDCCAMYRTGCAMTCTTPCIVGIVVGCKVGCKMMGKCQPKVYVPQSSAVIPSSGSSGNQPSGVYK